MQFRTKAVHTPNFTERGYHRKMADNVQNQSLPLARAIEAQLVEDISIGLLEPGRRLDEAGLAQRFGASRTPVREALLRLAAQGILVEGERRGIRVAEYTREELSQIFEAMHEIEIACARIAASRLTLLSRHEIEAAQAECITAAEAGDRTGFLRANEAFHQTIYRATGNPFIAELASDFRRRTGPFRAKKFVVKQDLLAAAESHERLMRDIFSKDSTTASNGMMSYMTESLSKALAAN
jgi:DNA-binding GntR family transcriptional regulator